MLELSTVQIVDGQPMGVVTDVDSIGLLVEQPGAAARLRITPRGLRPSASASTPDGSSAS